MRGDQNMAVNKIIYSETVLIDLTSDTVTEETMLSGVKGHDKTGKIITGTFLEGRPKTFEIGDGILDASEENILDSDSTILNGRVIYDRK